MQAFSSCGGQGLFSCRGARALGHSVFSSCSTWALVVVVQWLSCPRHVLSSRISDWYHVPCIGRQILNHWTTKKVLNSFIYLFGCVGSYLQHERSSLWHAGSIFCRGCGRRTLIVNSQLWHVGPSSLTQNRIPAPCIGRVES